MKMLNIVCGEKLEDEILAMFKDLGIRGYTVISGVGGSGQTGTVSGTGGRADRNTLFMAALEDDHIHMTQVMNAVRAIHTRHGHGDRGLETPLKAFLQPCEVIL